MQKVEFPSGGEVIRGTLIAPGALETKNPGVICFHGLTSKEDGYIPIARQLAALGVVGLTLSIRGHGKSEGDFNSLTVNDAYRDGLNAYDFLAGHDFIDPNRIGILGTSVGGAISATISSQRAVKSLVLRAPATYSDEMLNLPYSQILARVHEIFQDIPDIAATSAVRAISNFKGDLLAINSELDDIVPASITSQYLRSAGNACTKREVIIPGATHELTNPRWRERFVNEAVDWFADTL